MCSDLNLMAWSVLEYQKYSKMTLHQFVRASGCILTPSVFQLKLIRKKQDPHFFVRCSFGNFDCTIGSGTFKSMWQYKTNIEWLENSRGSFGHCWYSIRIANPLHSKRSPGQRSTFVERQTHSWMPRICQGTTFVVQGQHL